MPERAMIYGFEDAPSLLAVECITRRAGVGLSFLASIVLSMFNLPTVITFELVAMGLVFSVIVGIVAGIIPARNAASISPIEALRYE